MMVHEEVSSYVLEKINDFRQKTVAEIENWLQDEERTFEKSKPQINDVERYINDLSVEILFGDDNSSASNHRVIIETNNNDSSGTLNVEQINNIVAEYERSGNYLSEFQEENLDPVLSLADNITAEDKNLSPLVVRSEQTYSIDSHGNLILDTAKTINEIIVNNGFAENLQVHNNVENANVVQEFVNDFCVQENLNTNFINGNDINICVDLEGNLIETVNCTNNENSVQQNEINNNKTVGGNVEESTNGNTTCAQNFTPKDKSCERNDFITDINKQISNSSSDSETSSREQNTKVHLEIVTRALAELNITDEMLTYIRTDDNKKLWVCHVPNCQNTYRKLCQIKEHLLTHFGVKPFKCDFKDCSSAFNSMLKLKRHRKSHANVKEHICSELDCRQRFANSTNLAIHMKSCHRETRFVCPVNNCGERFPLKRNLGKHMRLQHGEEYASYVCDEPDCGKRFFTKSSFKSHQRVHGDRDYSCTWPGCTKIFDVPSRLKSHMLSHTGDKSYFCPYCDAGFSTASKLSRHERRHKDDRRYVCDKPGCGKSFIRIDHLKQHNVTHNNDREEYKCDYCQCILKSKSSMHSHLKKHLNGHFDRKSKYVQRRHKRAIGSDVAEEEKEVSAQQPRKKLKKSHSQKENMPPLNEIQQPNNPTDLIAPSSPRYQENNEIARIAFGEDYVDDFDNSLLTEELPPLYTCLQDNFQVPHEIQNDFNSTIDSNAHVFLEL